MERFGRAMAWCNCLDLLSSEFGSGVALISDEAWRQRVSVKVMCEAFSKTPDQLRADLLDWAAMRAKHPKPTKR